MDSADQFRPDIEGLRAIAILLVIGYHAQVPGFRGGYVGVDIFFVLSGYLITWLLVREIQTTGTISLRAFYARRARRLLPALTLLLLAAILAGALIYAPFEQNVIATTAAYTAAFSSNLYFAGEATNYLGASADTNPLLHTWSLGVEEQFYLVWPLFVLLAAGAWGQRRPPFNHRRLIVAMALAGGASFALALYLTTARQPLAFFLSPTRAWEFAIGALGVLLPERMVSRFFQAKFLRAVFDKSAPFRKGFSNAALTLENQNQAQRAYSRFFGWARGLRLAHPGDLALGVIGIVFVLLAGTWFDTRTLYPGIAALLPTLGTVFILRAGATRPLTGISRVLTIVPLQWIGGLSYGWYLWHWLVLVTARVFDPNPTLPVRIGLMLVALALAIASLHLVENPIRRNRVLARRPLVSLGLASVAILGSVALALVWRQASFTWAMLPEQQQYTRARADAPSVYGDDCHADAYVTSIDLARCTYGNKNGTGTVVLFGDSHAAQWFPALEAIATQKGWRLISLTKAACQPAELSLYYRVVGRSYDECTEWRQSAVDAMIELQPELVVVASVSKARVNLATWEQASSALLARLSPAARKIILLRDTPIPGFDVPTCLARRAWNPILWAQQSCAIKSAAANPKKLSKIQELQADKFDNVFIVDMNRFICSSEPCPAEINSTIVYRDESHLSKNFVKNLAPALSKQIDAAISK